MDTLARFFATFECELLARCRLKTPVSAPFYGLVGEKMVNVLEVNLELRKRFGAPA